MSYIYLNSSHAIDTAEPHNAVFNLNLKFQEHSKTYLELVSASFANARYPINSNNNTFVYEENSAASTTTSTITSQGYTGAQFATELQTRMNADTQESTTYTVTYNSQTKKLTITGSNNFRILSSSTCLDEIGFDEMNTAATSATGDYPIRLDGTEYVDVIASLTSNNISSGGRSNILTRIYMTSAFGEIQNYEAQKENKLKINSEQLSSISLRLFDSKNNRYVLPKNCRVSYTFRMLTESA